MNEKKMITDKKRETVKEERKLNKKVLRKKLKMKERAGNSSKKTKKLVNKASAMNSSTDSLSLAFLRSILKSVKYGTMFRLNSPKILIADFR
jgi:hypothetical protein